MGITIPVGAIYGSTQAGRLHRILTVSVVWGDAKQLMEIANAMAVVLPTEIARHLAQVGTGGVYASLIDPPAATVVAPSLRQRMDLPIRLLLGLVAGIAFVFLLDYLDDSVRTSQEVEDSGIRVLGEVPAFSGRSRHGLSRVTGPGWFRQRLP